MADLPTSFWGGWISVVTLVSLAGLVWLLFSIYFSAGNNDQQEHVVWDETLNEGTHPAPLWWFWLIFSTLIISAIYLILYPGLGSYSGVLKWSHGHRLEQSYATYEASYDPIRQSIIKTPLETLQADEFIMTSARGVFNRNCSVCHGPDAEGQAYTFPNLTDDDWQWGSSESQLGQTIRTGRDAVMPAWGAVLGEQGVSQIVQYIKTGPKINTPENDSGSTIYNQYCVACHGVDRTGNTAIGAPNLTDNIWLYGNSDEQLTATISNGRTGDMPDFQKRLDDVQIRMLIAWLTR